MNEATFSWSTRSLSLDPPVTTQLFAQVPKKAHKGQGDDIFVSAVNLTHITYVSLCEQTHGGLVKYQILTTGEFKRKILVKLVILKTGEGKYKKVQKRDIVFSK